MWPCLLYIARTHGRVRNDSETHETVLLDCMTGECVSLSFHTHPCIRAFITHIMYKRNWDGSCLINLIYFALHIFQIRNLLHCVDESWWNMPFKVTRLGDGVADNAVAMLPLWLHTAALWCHTISHNAWIGYEYSLPNLNCPGAIQKT